jgi:hypothetical protein
MVIIIVLIIAYLIQFVHYLAEKLHIKNISSSTIFSIGNIKSGAADGTISGLNKILHESIRAHINMNPIPPAVTLDDIISRLKYEPKTTLLKTSVHLGQRKLFLSELQFLTQFADAKYVIYAGSAPTRKHGFLCKLFPHIKFILVDPNNYEIIWADDYSVDLRSKGMYGPSPMVYLYDNHTVMNPYGNESKTNMKDGSRPAMYYDTTTDSEHSYDRKKNMNEIDKINANFKNLDKVESLRRFINTSEYNTFIIQDYFTEELAKYLHDVISDDIYFISDIRTIGVGDEYPNDIDILWNSAQQYNWLIALKARAYMFKFRPPFYNHEGDLKMDDTKRKEFKKATENGIDFLGDYHAGKFRYLDGKINLQAWPGLASTETRLVGTDIRLRAYNTNEYDEKLFFWNSVERCFIMHKNASATMSLGLDYCGDCALEVRIWEDYIKMSRRNIQVIGMVSILNNATISTWAFFPEVYYEKIFSNTKKANKC